MKYAIRMLTLALAMTAVMTTTSVAQSVLGQPVTLDVKETVVGEITDEVVIDSITTSSDSRRYGMARRGKDGLEIVIDGKVAGPYNLGSPPVFSPDGKRVGYHAKDGEDWIVFVDDKKYVGRSSPLFSPDSKRFLFQAKRDGKEYLVVDGKAHKAYDYLFERTVLFSNNSASVAYVAATKAGDFFVVQNGKAGKAYKSIQTKTPSLSVDGKHLAYIVSKGMQYYVVADGKEVGPYSNVKGRPVWNADGSRWAIVVAKADKWCVVINGQEGRPVLQVVPDSLAFSAKGDRLTYTFRTHNGYAIVVGDKTYKYDEIRPIVFSRDGEHYAFAGRSNGKWKLVLDGVAGAGYDDMSKRGITFSPDSKRLAAKVFQSGKWSIMADGKQGQTYKVTGSPLFSQDSKRLLYGAQRQKDNKIILVVDGNDVGKGFENILMPTVSSDGQHVAFLATDGNGWKVFVDGKAGPGRYEGSLQGSALKFSSSNKVHGLLVRDKKILFTEIEIK